MILLNIRPSLFRGVVLASLLLSISSCGSGGASELPQVSDRCDAETPLRVMPLGDSITGAREGFNSYRRRFYQRVIEAGCSIDLVGSRSGVSDGSLDGRDLLARNPDFDQDHEGHWMYTLDDMLPKIPGWLSNANPDVILLHMGSNDLFRDHGIEDTRLQLELLLDRIYQHNPRAAVFLAKLIPSVARADLVARFNREIVAIAEQRSAEGLRVYLVDLFDTIKPPQDLYDGIHPTLAAEERLGDAWADAFLSTLPAQDS